MISASITNEEKEKNKPIIEVCIIALSTGSRQKIEKHLTVNLINGLFWETLSPLPSIHHPDIVYYLDQRKSNAKTKELLSLFLFNLAL
jgi:hypothetical protein